MRKAGGIVALVAGVFAVGAALFTLLAGGLGGALEAEGAETVIWLGWGGVLFSFLTIVLGAVTIGAKGRVPGILLIVCAIAGAILGRHLRRDLHGAGGSGRDPGRHTGAERPAPEGVSG